ncbi:MAG: hypothetical protein MUF64_01190 [Polyangiaceae bacterium]|jgi:hypothetical protein|nr:hypothetical protein [Polyangiaceae bacterium]
MLRVRAESYESRPGLGDLQEPVLTGLIEVASLVATSGAPLSEHERHELARLVSLFLGGHPPVEEVLPRLLGSEQALQAEGYDARIDALLAALPSMTLRKLALQLGAEVLCSSSNFRLDREGELFLALGLALGLSRPEILERIREALLRA